MLRLTLTTSSTTYCVRSPVESFSAVDLGTTRSFTLSKLHCNGDFTNLCIAQPLHVCCGGCINCSFLWMDPSLSCSSMTVSKQCGRLSFRWKASRNSVTLTMALPFTSQYSLIRFRQNFNFDSQLTGFTDFTRNGANRFSIRSSSCQHTGWKSTGNFTPDDDCLARGIFTVQPNAIWNALHAICALHEANAIERKFFFAVMARTQLYIGIETMQQDYFLDYLFRRSCQNFYIFRTIDWPLEVSSVRKYTNFTTVNLFWFRPMSMT